MSLDQVTKEALALPLEDRTSLLEALMDDFDSRVEEKWDPEYLAELDRRADELESGEVKGWTWEEVKAAAKSQVKCG